MAQTAAACAARNRGWGRGTVRLTTALIIIDVQKGFIRPATAHVPARVAALQGAYATVTATRFVNPQGSAHRRLIGWRRFAPGETGTELAFAPAPHVEVVEKTTYSCLTDGLREILGSAGARDVHLCGIATDNCVLASAGALFEAGLTPVVLAAACGSHAGTDYHDWGLRILRRLIGTARVRD